MMSKLATLSVIKKMLLPGVFAAVLATGLGMQATGVSAEGRSKLWSVAVHIEYADGFVYENVIAAGVTTDVMRSMLAECGHSHWTGSVVRYHCFPIPE
jgi:hypothetical protein